AGAGGDARKHVAEEVVGAEPVRGGGAGRGAERAAREREVAGVGVPADGERAEEREEREGGDEAEAEEPASVAAEARPGRRRPPPRVPASLPGAPPRLPSRNSVSSARNWRGRSSCGTWPASMISSFAPGIWRARRCAVGTG